MQSPRFLRNLSLLLLTTANLGVAVFAVSRTGADGAASATGVLLRSGSFVYAGGAALLLLLALCFFAALELAPTARSAWRRLSLWEAVKPGMTPEELRALLGPPPTEPRASDLQPEEDQWHYPIHPLGALDEGCLAFSRGAEPRLLWKLPTDDVLARIRAERWPAGYAGSNAREKLKELAGLLSLAGLILLALAALLPIGAGGRWSSWTLHAPATALLFAAVYEGTQKGGWRFDRLFVVPLYGIIAAGWGLRLWLLLRTP